MIWKMVALMSLAVLTAFMWLQGEFDVAIVLTGVWVVAMARVVFFHDRMIGGRKDRE